MTRILVVDDSPVDRRLAGRLLEKVPDVEIFYAENGKLGLEEVEAHVPDLVVTDMQMPELDGLELVSRMKKQYPMIPVILMTAAGSEEIAVQALQRGAASYVPKRKLAEELADIAVCVMSMSREQRTQARVLNRMQRLETEFVVENDLQLDLSLSAHLQQDFGGMRICDQAEGLRVGIALEEALLNAFYHGNLEDYQSYYDLATKRCKESPYQSRRILVSARLSRPEAVFTIRDEGPGFNPAVLPDPTDPANLERPYGRGLMLMRTFMSDVRYNSTGNEVCLVKRATPSGT